MIRAVAVGSPSGLHLRAAGRLASTAAQLGVPVTIRRGDRAPVPADSVLALLTLGAVHGTELILEADGPEAESALDRLVAVIDNESDDNGG